MTTIFGFEVREEETGAPGGRVCELSFVVDPANANRTALVAARALEAMRTHVADALAARGIALPDAAPEGGWNTTRQAEPTVAEIVAAAIAEAAVSAALTFAGLFAMIQEIRHEVAGHG